MISGLVLKYLNGECFVICRCYKYSLLASTKFNLTVPDYIRLADPQRPLFASQKGGHFSANTMCQLFLDIYKAIGLKDASSHSGRRTYITRLANKGVGVRLLAALAGHSHISTTQRYIDVNSEQLSEAVELL
jgi:integrase/recombinase XerD